MNLTCPNCSKTLKIGDKIQNSIKELAPGKALRLNCPKCDNTISLDTSCLTTTKQPPPKASATTIKPPDPPNIDWLKEGMFEEEEVVEDIPQTLILAKPSKEIDIIAKAVESIGYQASYAESGKDAMDKMQFVHYSSVILRDDFEEGGISGSEFHQYMCDMPMLKRRFIFYILIGNEFSTLYDLQALANSANLVVNDREIPDLLTILRKSIPKYEELFGNLMSEISAYGG